MENTEITWLRLFSIWLTKTIQVAETLVWYNPLMLRSLRALECVIECDHNWIKSMSSIRNLLLHLSNVRRLYPNDNNQINIAFEDLKQVCQVIMNQARTKKKI